MVGAWADVESRVDEMVGKMSQVMENLAHQPVNTGCSSAGRALSDHVVCLLGK